MWKDGQQTFGSGCLHCRTGLAYRPSVKQPDSEVFLLDMIIPCAADDCGLNPNAFRLYFHLLAQKARGNQFDLETAGRIIDLPDDKIAEACLDLVCQGLLRP